MAGHKAFLWGKGEELTMKLRKFSIGVVVLSVLFLFGCAHNSVRQDSQAPVVTAAVSDQNQETKSTQAPQIQPDTAKETETKLAEDKEDITEEGEEEAPQIADPFYIWNKGWYYFNDKFYFWLLKPVARGYSFIFPEIARIGVSNFFYNITTPIRFVNSVLQFKMKDAGNEMLRLVINSTLGVGGLGDFAKGQLDIKRKNEDLGQTFGAYGVGHGFYLVWPIFGPSSLRDTVGLVGDGFLNPINYIRPVETSIAITAYDTVNHTSLHIGDYEDIIEAAVDPYVSIRDAYAQNRKKKVDE
ncbi:MAG: VacJ family lipoprotein [Nitrospirota bacterium]